MEHKIVADSSCDLSPELKAKWGATTIPFTMTLGEKDFRDDETLDLPSFMEEMKRCTGKIGSALPSPHLYKEAFEGGQISFGITISSKLSGSYSSAMLGKRLAEEESGAEVHIFDSLSASAGEVLVALKIHAMIELGFQKAKIIASVEAFIKEMKTYFVLENINNLLKNGRLNKVTGKLISVLGIKPIMGSDGEGNIALFSHGRGRKQILDKLVRTIAASGKNTENESLVITHCNNADLAATLADAIRKRHQFKEILIFPTGGLSSVYADEKGVIMAF
ncbi:MAG: DegV family EDD domain-containing protein [Oscillospiraceae bacterium]|jgi:DegV family protein with EDD domain|nr:DegV family EDD domain-containing protein [Oscillospiraceae bacterium]